MNANKDWLKSFSRKVGLGACICEGQEITSAVNEINKLREEIDIALIELEKTLQKLESLEAMKSSDEWGPYAKAKARLHVKLVVEGKARVELEKKLLGETERCAVVAWNHFMEVCKKFGLAPANFEHWCASSAIRMKNEEITS